MDYGARVLYCTSSGDVGYGLLWKPRKRSCGKRFSSTGFTFAICQLPTSKRSEEYQVHSHNSQESYTATAPIQNIVVKSSAWTFRFFFLSTVSEPTSEIRPIMGTKQRKNATTKNDETAPADQAGEVISDVGHQLDRALATLQRNKMAMTTLYVQWRSQLLKMSYLIMLVIMHQLQKPTTLCMKEIKVCQTFSSRL